MAYRYRAFQRILRVLSVFSTGWRPPSGATLNADRGMTRPWGGCVLWLLLLVLWFPVHSCLSNSSTGKSVVSGCCTYWGNTGSKSKASSQPCRTHRCLVGIAARRCNCSAKSRFGCMVLLWTLCNTILHSRVVCLAQGSSLKNMTLTKYVQILPGRQNVQDRHHPRCIYGSFGFGLPPVGALCGSYDPAPAVVVFGTPQPIYRCPGPPPGSRGSRSLEH